ncbi:glycosyltransferase family 4 protein [Bacillus subtilis]|nr:glycosyltransferase family 4 protein [Bacillus subtilis]MDM5301083.1 glycosyltransferase family 4 protein [Bacillus subtilis]MDM5323136.1 glycosyltransferase family 4 protein [Bacillus subtilis]
MKFKILMITQNFYPEIGSAGNRMKNMFLMLKQKGYHVEVLTTEPTYPSREIYSQDCLWNEQEIDFDQNITRLSVQNKKYSTNLLSRLFYYLEIMFKMFFYVTKDKKKFDIVFVTSPPIFVAFVGLVAKYKYKARMLLDVRDLWPESLKGVGVFHHSLIIWLFEKIESALYRKADHIIINSEGFITHFKNKSEDLIKKLMFLPNAARKNEIVLRERQETSTFHVVYAGNIGLAQDVTILKQLAEKLDYYNISLTVIGYGVHNQNFADFVHRHELKNVKLLKPMGRQDCLNQMALCDVGIAILNNSNVFETVLPGKIIDYLTCKLPVVASLSGYPKKLIEDKKIGFVTNSQSVDEMVDYILKLYHNSELLRMMKQNCGKFIEENFLWENNINKLTNVIDKITKG